MSRSKLPTLVSTLLVSCACLAEPTSRGASAAGARIGADVGAGWNILSIAASGFQSRPGQTVTVNAVGYRLADFANFEAPVLLPSGSGIGYLAVFAYDTDGLSHVVARIVRYTGFGSIAGCTTCTLKAPAVEDIAYLQTDTFGGYQYAITELINPLHTVDNDVVSTGGQYAVQVNLVQLAGQLGFRGVEIWWKRQISPAPAAATFVDVPTTHLFFREIEALAAAGITVGCTATTFCPNGPLTRAQMAAFLARALGLYWQF